MSNKKVITFSLAELFEQMQIARQAAGIILKNIEIGKDPLLSLYPLVLALLESADTYEFLDSKHSDKHINRLFNLVEGDEPDLYTRLCFVRDQCNSLDHCLLTRYFQEEEENESLFYRERQIISVGIDPWIELVTKHVKVDDEELLRETAMLLDDILWSVLSISRSIVIAKEKNLKFSWSSIHTDTSHIQSHFDLTGDYLMDIMLLSSS